MAIVLFPERYWGALADTETICVPSRTESSTTVKSKKALVSPAGIVIDLGTVSSDKSLDLSVTVTFETAGEGNQTCPCKGSVPSPSEAETGKTRASRAEQDEYAVKSLSVKAAGMP